MTRYHGDAEDTPMKHLSSNPIYDPEPYFGIVRAQAQNSYVNPKPEPEALDPKLYLEDDLVSMVLEHLNWGYKKV